LLLLLSLLLLLLLLWAVAIFGAGCVVGADVPARGDFAELAGEEGEDEDEERAVKGREERLKKRSFGFAVEAGCAITDEGADRFRKDKGCEGENVTPPFLLFCPDDFPEVDEEEAEEAEGD
jgi:hypothetical protein